MPSLTHSELICSSALYSILGHIYLTFWSLLSHCLLYWSHSFLLHPSLDGYRMLAVFIFLSQFPYPSSEHGAFPHHPCAHSFQDPSPQPEVHALAPSNTLENCQTLQLPFSVMPPAALSSSIQLHKLTYFH